ncbi:MAG: hypothetical protein KF784_10005 [Fimbriimonadaceae bacterium]|nr:hypothetical protein [Fimbriimonadaceae bacterium]
MKKMLMIIIPLVLIGGGIFGAAKMGMVQIPGISPAKKTAGLYDADKEALGLYNSDKIEPTVLEETSPPATVATQPTVKPPEPDYQVDIVQGRKKLAKLWNSMDVATLLRITADWKDEDLAPQLAVMEPEKVALLLGSMDASRASKISKLIQEEASKVYGDGG